MNYHYLLSILLFSPFASSSAMNAINPSQSDMDHNQALIDAVKASDVNAIHTALNNGASAQCRSHWPIYETLRRDNLEIFKRLIPYYESVGSWQYAAEQENATKIVAYIKDQKLIQGNSKKNENRDRPSHCSN